MGDFRGFAISCYTGTIDTMAMDPATRTVASLLLVRRDRNHRFFVLTFNIAIAMHSTMNHEMIWLRLVMWTTFSKHTNLKMDDTVGKL